jgi:histone H3/H4
MSTQNLLLFSCAYITQVQTSALEALTSVMEHYIHQLGRDAQALANHGSRAQCNLGDVSMALEDTGASLIELEAFLIKVCSRSSLLFAVMRS